MYLSYMRLFNKLLYFVLVTFPTLGETCTIWWDRVHWDIVGQAGMSESEHAVCGRGLLRRELHLQRNRPVPVKFLRVTCSLNVVVNPNLCLSFQDDAYTSPSAVTANPTVMISLTKTNVIISTRETTSVRP